MASRSTEAVPIGGRVDRDGRLIAADPALERLQLEAGSALGRALALPQLAALARAAAALGVPLSRAVVAADHYHDLDLFVRAEPVDDDVVLTIERWVARPMAPPRLALVETIDDDERRATERTIFEFDVDAHLNLLDLSPALANLLEIDHSAALGRPLTSLFRLIEETDGSMPLLAAGRHMLSVIRAMGQGNAPAPQRLDVEQLARDAVGLVQPAADQRGIAIALGRFDASCAVAGEAHAIVQILVNILGNAVRHSPDGASVAVLFDQTSSECRVIIADQGPGIAPADQQRIFERYERVGTAPDGSGLGLAIARRLARSIGGDITLESALGKGARFTLVLPAA